jgi:glucuronosyltransferase
MPEHLLEEFLHTFTAIPSIRFIWQTNSDPAELIGKRKIPGNLIPLQWAPIKSLMAHPNLHFVILHGGINTVNELLFFGVPALGVPLQGDQLSNIQRLVELGVAEMATIRELHQPGMFLQKLLHLESNLPLLKKRAQKVSAMVTHHRELNANSQNFWLHWAQRHGRDLQSKNSMGKDRNIFEQHQRSSIDYFAVKEVACWVLVAGILVTILSH